MFVMLIIGILLVSVECDIVLLIVIVSMIVLVVKIFIFISDFLFVVDELIGMLGRL